MKIWKTQKDGEWMDKYQNVADHYTGCSGPTWLIVIQQIGLTKQCTIKHIPPQKKAALLKKKNYKLHLTGCLKSKCEFKE